MRGGGRRPGNEATCYVRKTYVYMYTVLSIPKKLGISILYTIVPNTINTLMQERKRRAKFSYNIYVSTCTPVFSGSLEEHREG